MAVKSATVNASLVAATLTDYPTYIDLSRLGITTLAEAQSVRIYTDAGLTNEIAREIVSTTECHAKVPSLTTTTQLWVDYDGVRADYAVGATYGRNAVWGGYDYVTHAGGGGTDSTGNTLAGTAGGGVISGGISGKIGSATLYDGANDYFSYGDVLDYVGNVNVYISAWAKRNGVQPDFWAIVSKQNGSGATDQYEIRGANSTVKHDPVMQVRTSSAYLSSSATLGGATTMADATWYLFHGQAEASSGLFTLHMNGASAGSRTHPGYSIQNTSSSFKIGAQTVSSNRFFRGDIDEVRIGQTMRNASWITTEYNNQNDESLFWGTWSDAGGGAAASAAARRLIFFGI